MALTPRKSPPRPLMDGKTRDWKIVNGQRQADETHASEVLFTLTQQKGSSPAYPDVGSEYHKNKTITEQTPDRVRLQTEAALKTFTGDGRITGLVAEATNNGGAAGRVRLSVKWQDSKGKTRTITLGVG